LEFADRREALPLAFESDEELVRLATFYAELGGKDDLEDNLISTELPGGLQFDAILPPAALPPQITIQATRAQSAPTLAELAATGCIPCPAEAILMTAIKARLNLVVSGPTGIGASQLASALLGAIEPWERTSVIDPDQGLTLPQAGVGDFFRVGRWPSSELRDALIRQVTARIVLADVTRHGALHLLPPWTGIEGSIAVIRAGDARQALTRLGLSVSLGSPGLSQESVNEIVDGSVDLILHVDQRPRGASHSWRLALLAFVDLNRERPSRLPVLVRCGSLRPQGVQWEWSSAALASPPAKVVEKLRAAGVYPGALAAGALDGDG
jgi:Flp pilus assembly CpaF family ATPase